MGSPNVLENILTKLGDTVKDAVSQIRDNVEFKNTIQGQLEEAGWLKGGVDEEQVIKALTAASHDVIEAKVDLKENTTQQIERNIKQIEVLLGIAERKKKSINDYFQDGENWKEFLSTLKSPLHMARSLKETSDMLPQWLVENLIKHQYKIKWNTEDGKPTNYTFYKFCDHINTMQFLKFKPRQAHVKATLYTECRREDMNTLEKITKEQLCPNVYIKTKRDGWKMWKADKVKDAQDGADTERNEFRKINGDFKNELAWINDDILSFIDDNADDEQAEDNLETSLCKPTLYWAVLNDRDFAPGEILELDKVGETQVYVGKADNGIQGRWISSGSHCDKMKRCLDSVCAMTTYDPSKLDGVQLVDARLTLAKVRKEDTALFVMKTFGDVLKNAEIVDTSKERKNAYENAKKACHKARREYVKTKQECEKAVDGKDRIKNAVEILNKARAHVEQCEDELYEALSVPAATKDSTSKEEADQEVKSKLKEAEKQHIRGKKLENGNQNIINLSLTNGIKPIRWNPKNMAYGMNCI